MPKPYKILLSAYACEPNRGSEPAVGWNWALQIAQRGHEVWVITRANNKAKIEHYFSFNTKPNNLNFIYYDWAFFIKLKNIGIISVHIYYLLWQLSILKIVKSQHNIVKFDLIQHITFSSIHIPSFLYRIKNVCFVLGPCGGGDITPIRFLHSFPIIKTIKEILLLIWNKALKFGFIRNAIIKKSNLIYVNSAQTFSFLSADNKKNSKISLAIGIDSSYITDIPECVAKSQSIKLLFVGRLCYWKGIHMALKAYNLISEKFDISFTIIGSSMFPINKFTNKKVELLPWQDYSEVNNSYSNYDILLLPSFRDSGGFVVLEALANGLPVICLDKGGPGQIVNDNCGKLINIVSKSESTIVDEIKSEIMLLYSKPDLLRKKSLAAQERAEEFTWKKTVNIVYTDIESYLN